MLHHTTPDRCCLVGWGSLSVLLGVSLAIWPKLFPLLTLAISLTLVYQPDSATTKIWEVSILTRTRPCIKTCVCVCSNKYSTYGRCRTHRDLDVTGPVLHFLGYPGPSTTCLPRPTCLTFKLGPARLREMFSWRRQCARSTHQHFENLECQLNFLVLIIFRRFHNARGQNEAPMLKDNQIEALFLVFQLVLFSVVYNHMRRKQLN